MIYHGFYLRTVYRMLYLYLLSPQEEMMLRNSSHPSTLNADVVTRWFLIMVTSRLFTCGLLRICYLPIWGPCGVGSWRRVFVWYHVHQCDTMNAIVLLVRSISVDRFDVEPSVG